MANPTLINVLAHLETGNDHPQAASEIGLSLHNRQGHVIADFPTQNVGRLLHSDFPEFELPITVSNQRMSDCFLARGFIHFFNSGNDEWHVNFKFTLTFDDGSQLSSLNAGTVIFNFGYTDDYCNFPGMITKLTSAVDPGAETKSSYARPWGPSRESVAPSLTE